MIVAPLRMEIGERSNNSNREGMKLCYYRTVLVTNILYIYLYHYLREACNNKSNLLTLILVTRQRYKSNLTIRMRSY